MIRALWEWLRVISKLGLLSVVIFASAGITFWWSAWIGTFALDPVQLVGFGPFGFSIKFIPILIGMFLAYFAFLACLTFCFYAIFDLKRTTHKMHSLLLAIDDLVAT